MSREIHIGERAIGPAHDVYIIAEAGINHNGSIDRAIEMCEVAAKCGCDAVKFQAYHLSSLKHERAVGVLEALRRAELSAPNFDELRAVCRDLGIEFLCSPYDVGWLNTLVKMGMRAVKVASALAVNRDFMEAAIATELPLLVSTGAVKMRTGWLGHAGLSWISNPHVTLHCISEYPVGFEQQRLSWIRENGRYRLVGYSDHSYGIISGGLAVAAGACVLEKHFTMDRKLPGPDHHMSLEPQWLKIYVMCARESWQACRGGEQ